MSERCEWTNEDHREVQKKAEKPPVRLLRSVDRNELRQSDYFKADTVPMF